MPYDPEIPPRDAVADRCKKAGYDQNGLAYNDRIWVKYGPYVSLAEADLQRYVHKHADRNIVRIPEVYDVFQTPIGERSLTYIVMEHIKGENCTSYLGRHSTPDEEEKLMEAIAKAVRHIWTIPIPRHATPGPFHSRKPVDRFSSDSGSDQAFDNLNQLEHWINRRLVKVRPKENISSPGERISLQGEQMIICHCDLSPDNILVGEPITIIDWGFSGIYPKCFDEFAICHQFTLSTQQFARALHKQLFGLILSKRMLLLSRVATYNLWGR